MNPMAETSPEDCKKLEEQAKAIRGNLKACRTRRRQLGDKIRPEARPKCGKATKALNDPNKELNAAKSTVSNSEKTVKNVERARETGEVDLQRSREEFEELDCGCGLVNSAKFRIQNVFARRRVRLSPQLSRKGHPQPRRAALRNSSTQHALASLIDASAALARYFASIPRGLLFRHRRLLPWTCVLRCLRRRGAASSDFDGAAVTSAEFTATVPSR